MKLLASLEALNAPELKGWTLAGGTGLALQLGHRTSEDFDFFRTEPLDVRTLHTILSKTFSSEALLLETKTLTLLLNDVKISFFIVDTPFIFSGEKYLFFTVADPRDIALMKIAAIAGRGSRRDFIDLYFILHEHITLDECLQLFKRKYRNTPFNIYHILKSLTWFEDAEAEPEPHMLKPFSWSECKRFFLQETQKIVLP